MPNYAYYKSLASQGDEEDQQQAPAGESPAAAWVRSMEDPNSILNTYGTGYSGGTGEAAGQATGKILRSERPVEPAETTTTRATNTLKNVYTQLSAWREYLGWGTPVKDSPYVNPQWGKGNIRTVRGILRD